MAHVEGNTLETSGTITMSRPICNGSMLLSTVPRYFPKNFATSDPFSPDRQNAIVGTAGTFEISAFRFKVKLCLYSPSLIWCFVLST